MSDYTPTTEEVRKRYSDDVIPPKVFYSEEEAQQYEAEFYAEFDRWLAEVQAQAWEEGYISGTVDTHRNEVSKGNPYRQGEEQ